MSAAVGGSESVKEPGASDPDSGKADESGSEIAQKLESRIREAAYLMWEAAGGHHGHSLDYWLAAEQEIMAALRSVQERTSEKADDQDQNATSKKADPSKEP